MRIIISSLVVASSLIVAPFSFAETLPICGSADDAMLGACQLEERIPVFSAKDLTSLTPSSSLPTIPYIGGEIIAPSESPKLSELKTLPLEFSQENNNSVEIPPLEVSQSSEISDTFPIPYRSLKDAKTKAPSKLSELKTLPISSGKSFQSVFSPVSPIISEIVQSDKNRDISFVSRGEACKIVSEVLALPVFEGNNKISIFSDVTSESQYFSAINALKNVQIIDGYNNGTFNPTQNIVYSEVYKVFAIAFDFAKSTDEKNGNDWFVPFKAALAGLSLNVDDSQAISRTDFYKLLDVIVIKETLQNEQFSKKE